MRFRRVWRLASKGNIRNTHMFLLRKPERMGQLGRNGRRCVENINSDQILLISNFRRVLNVVCFLLGNSPASEFYVPTFRNTLPVPHTATCL